MPAQTATGSYYESLESAEKKLQLILDYNFVDRQLFISDEEKEELNGLSRKYFAPKTPDGEPDTKEMSSRFGELFKQKVKLEQEFGKDILKIKSELPANLTEEEKDVIAVEKAGRTSMAGAQLKNINAFLKDVILNDDSLTPKDVNAFLEKNKVPVIEPLDPDNQKEAEKANREALLKKVDDTYAQYRRKYEAALKGEEKTKMQLAGKSVNIYSISNDKQKLAQLSTEERLAAEDAKRNKANELRDNLENIRVFGAQRMARQATARPLVLANVSEILHSTGKGDAFWHKNNSEEFEAVLNYTDAYVTVAQKGASNEEMEQARENTIKMGLKYLDGKEKVRSSQFGKDRFDAVMTSMAVLMDAADFQKLADKINKKRGVKEGEPDFVTRDFYLNKASAIGGRVATVASEKNKYVKSMKKYNPLEGGQKYDLSAFSFGNRSVNSWDFQVLAEGAEGMKEPNPRDAVNKALISYHSGNKEELANLIAHTLKGLARKTNALDDVTSPDNARAWVANAEKMATIHDILVHDEELANLAAKVESTRTVNKQEVTEKVLDEETLKFSLGAVEAGRMVGRSEIARERLNKFKDLSEEEKRSLYTDIAKVNYIDSQLAAKNNNEDVLGTLGDNLRAADLAFAGNEIGKKNAKETLKGGERMYSGTISGLRDPERRKNITNACRNALDEIKPEKLSFNKASQKMGSHEFNNKTVKDAIIKESQPEKGGMKM